MTMTKTKTKHRKTRTRTRKTKRRTAPTTLPTVTIGVDVSTFQNTVDWVKVKAAGAQFAYLKASEGVTITDDRFATNRKNAKAAGLIIGAYHLFRPLDTPQAQFDNFRAAIGNVEPGELPPVLDVEVPEDWKNIPVVTRVQIVEEWLDLAEAKLGISPIIYANIGDVKGLLNNDQRFAKRRYWLAQFTTATVPVLPAPWTDWTFWQHDQFGRIDGITTNCDLDRFQGTLADLMKLAKPSQSSSTGHFYSAGRFPSCYDRARYL